MNRDKYVNVNIKMSKSFKVKMHVYFNLLLVKLVHL